MFDIKTAILVVIISGVLSQEVTYDCDNEEEVDRLDAKVLECQRKKWAPLPAPEVWDITVCCFRLERDCVYNKMIRSKCRPKEKFFEEDVDQRYHQMISECKTNLSIDISDEICGRRPTKAVTDEICQTWLPCTLNDPIPTSPNTLPPTEPTKATEAPKGTEATKSTPKTTTKGNNGHKQLYADGITLLVSVFLFVSQLIINHN